MAVIEASGLMKYKDADGNTYLLLPVTTKENIDGMEEIDAHLIDTTVHVTSADKSKWNAAEANQNAFGKVVVGSTTITADAEVDTLTVAGSNVTITPDATNDKVTIGITKDNVVAALGYTPPTTNTTYSAAGSSLGLVKTGGDVTITSGVITVNDDSHNHTISNVDGLQTALDAKVPTSRTVNGKALSANISLTASDVGADASGSAVTVQDNLDDHTGNSDIHFTATERTKLSGIAAGAQVNSITGVKGNSESSYRTGNVNITKANIGLGNVDNTSDANKPVSTAQQTAIDTALSSAKSYTDGKIDALVGDGASETLDTIGEIASAIEDNQDMLTTLNTAIGQKANSSDLTSHTGNTTVHITAAERTKWNAGEANQNAFSNVVVGSTTIAADSETDSLTIAAGTGITVAGDATNDKVTITNSGVRSIATGGTNGTISVNTNGTSANVAVKGLGSAAYTASTAYDAAGSADTVQDNLDTHTGNADIHFSATERTKLENTNVAYGTCSTAADTAAKVITISGNTNWTLAAGSTIVIKFSYTNTASNPTFNVNGTGAKSVWYNTGVLTTSSLSYAGYANRPMEFIYDGTQYLFVGWSYDSNTTYTNDKLGHGYGTCTTAEATTAKAVTLSKYTLVTGGIVAVKFTYAVPASATMNINSKGAKAIYHKGAAIKAGAIKAGDTATFIYNGTYYHLISVDRDDDTTYSAATTSAAGLMSAADKTKLDGIATGANAYTHPSYTARTGVPTANQTPAFGGTFSVSQPVSDATGHITAINSRTITIPSAAATTSAAGLMSAADKTKLDGIAAGAQVNSITGVKGNSESSYRTGNVNITKANIGLGSVDNTSDANKPVSTAQQTAINTALSTAKSYTDDKIDALVGEGASETLDTIGEISAAIEGNQDMLSTLNSAIGSKSNIGHTHTVSHTPAGSVESTFTGTAATSGTPSGTSTVASSTHTHKYTPSGTVSKPTFTGSAVNSGEPDGTTSVYSITGVGSVPSLTTSVANHCLTFTFSAGSVPTRSSVTVASSTHKHSVTAAGSVSQPTFTGTEASTTSITGTTSVASSGHTHSVTATGSVSSTFKGTAASLTTGADN